MNKAIFERETSICHDLHNSNGGQCNWGECDKCGVIPFIYKIFKDEQIEDFDEIKRIKKEIFEN
jgi:hypothetical protein